MVKVNPVKNNAAVNIHESDEEYKDFFLESNGTCQPSF
jgi:hypothetical protein